MPKNVWVNSRDSAPWRGRWTPAIALFNLSAETNNVLKSISDTSYRLKMELSSRTVYMYNFNVKLCCLFLSTVNVCICQKVVVF